MRRALLSMLLGALVLPGAAFASFPGQNGRIAFGQEFSIRTMNPDGTGEQVFLADPPRRQEASWSPDGKQVVYRKGMAGRHPELAVVNADGTGDHLITDNTYAEWNPQWSADGTRIIFWAEPIPTGQFDFHIFVVDADGGPATQLTTTGINRHPVWKPDGTKIAWEGPGGLADIWTMNPDGSGKVNLTNSADIAENTPDWSPDGTRIAFRGGDFSGDIDDLRVMNADGSNPVVIADPPPGLPVWAVQWSPDGTKIAYNAGAEMYVVNPDGTGNTLIRSPAAGWALMSDWIPIPVNGYPRPQGATPLRVSLVPAYAQCTSPNRVHGPPLDSDSCNPPVLRSDEVTVGTPDSNGETSNAQASVRYETLVGNPATPADEADVRINVSLTDIYEQGTFPDYAGELRATTTLRITDKLNHPYPGGPQAGTVTDTVLGVNVPCTPTADPDVGATCAVSTTMDALAPGAVVEGRRAIWRLGQVQLEDGGADGDAETIGDNTLFMTQGIFVP